MSDLPLLSIHTDGASRGNPGLAASAYIISQQGKPPIEVAQCLGQLTNNQAEYTALVKALEHALELGANHRLNILSDSELMVKQMKHEYRVKNEELKGLYEDAQDLVSRFQGEVTFQHVRRGDNARADALCNEALDGKRISGRDTLDQQSSVPSVTSDKKTVSKKPKKTEKSTTSIDANQLQKEAVGCLWEAFGAWSAGNIDPDPFKVWNRLVAILEKNGVVVSAGQEAARNTEKN